MLIPNLPSSMVCYNQHLFHRHFSSRIDSEVRRFNMTRKLHLPSASCPSRTFLRKRLEGPPHGRQMTCPGDRSMSASHLNPSKDMERDRYINTLRPGPLYTTAHTTGHIYGALAVT